MYICSHAVQRCSGSRHCRRIPLCESLWLHQQMGLNVYAPRHRSQHNRVFVLRSFSSLLISSTQNWKRWTFLFLRVSERLNASLHFLADFLSYACTTFTEQRKTKRGKKAVMKTVTKMTTRRMQIRSHRWSWPWCLTMEGLTESG